MLLVTMVRMRGDSVVCMAAPRCWPAVPLRKYTCMYFLDCNIEQFKLGLSRVKSDTFTNTVYKNTVHILYTVCGCVCVALIVFLQYLIVGSKDINSGVFLQT